MLFAGGHIDKNNQVWVFERWDIREAVEKEILFWNDAYDIDKLVEEKLALLHPTPIISLN